LVVCSQRGGYVLSLYGVNIIVKQLKPHHQDILPSNYLHGMDATPTAQVIVQSGALRAHLGAKPHG